MVARIFNYSFQSIPEGEFRCLMEMVASTVIVFIVTFIIVLIVNVLITCLFVRHQKQKFLEQLQSISEAIPEGKRFVRPRLTEEQGRQSQVEQQANNVRPSVYATVPYYNTVRSTAKNHISVQMESNPAYS